MRRRLLILCNNETASLCPQREALIEHRLHGLHLLHLVFGKIPVGTLSTDDSHNRRDIAAAFSVTDLFLADTSHPGRVADAVGFVFGCHS